MGRNHDGWPPGRAALVPALVALATLACDGGKVAGSTYPTTAVVYGRVLASDGASIEGATVRGDAFNGSCHTGRPAALAAGVPLSTDVEGRYRLEFVALIVFEACVLVTVTLPATLGQLPVVAEGSPLKFRLHRQGDVDSLRIDVQFP